MALAGSLVLRIGLVAGLAVGAALPAYADAVFDGIAALPGAVEDVRVGGTWEKDGKSGAYRIVVARSGTDQITARLFIQWVAYDDAGGASLEQTIEIGELAALKLDIVDFSSESDEEGLAVYIQTLNPTGDVDESYELFVISPTEYRFGPESH